MRNATALICATILGVAAMCASLAADAAPRKGKTFDTWEVACEKQPDGKSERCFAQQIQTVKESGNRLLMVAVGRFGAKKDLGVVVMMPLGLNLQMAPAFKVDDGQQVLLSFQTCATDGCRAAAPLTEAGLKALTSGKQMVVGVVPWGSEQTVAIPVPLKGLSAALAAAE